MRRHISNNCARYFGLKIDVSFDDNVGWATFEMGTAHMTAGADMLTVTCDVNDAKAVKIVHHAIDSHLETFAFREEVKTMTWVTA